MGGDLEQAARSYLAEQVAVLRATCPLAASGDDDAVHDARTAARRARAVVAVCRDLLPPAEGRAARAGLRTLGRRLGAARDPAVELAWLRDPRSGDGRALPVRLVAELESARTAALHELRRALASPGYGELLDLLDRLAASPWMSADEESGIRRGARRQWRRLDRALAAARHDEGRTARDAALHAARRQARRARYAAEIVGRRAAQRSAAAVQDALGSQHDAVLVRDAVGAAAAHAMAAGERVGPYDDLRSRADNAAREAERDAAPAVRRALRHGHRHGHRHWLR